VSIAGAPPFGGRLARVGLCLVAVGLLGVALGTTLIVIPPGSNELQSWPFVILVLGGGLASIIGSLVCGLSLVRMPGGPRLAGLVLLAGGLGLAFLPIGFALPSLGFAGIGLFELGLGRTRQSSRA